MTRNETLRYLTERLGPPCGCETCRINEEIGWRLGPDNGDSPFVCKLENNGDMRISQYLDGEARSLPAPTPPDLDKLINQVLKRRLVYHLQGNTWNWTP